MAAKKPPAKDEAATPPAAPSEGPATPPEQPATPPEQPATPPEQPATPPSDGEKPPAERVEMSKDVTGDAPPPGAVRFAPVERYVLEEKVPVRAGGYVCTDHGWVLDPEAEQPTGPGVVDPVQVEQAEKTVRAEKANQTKLAEPKQKKG